jgi:hypothetical protein
MVDGKKRVLADALLLKTHPRARQLGRPTPGLFGRISRVWDTIRGKIRVKTEYVHTFTREKLSYSNDYGMQISQVQSLRRALVLLV